MSVQNIDKNWGHLYPTFRDKLRLALERTAEQTGTPWFIAEGYRSQERQLWLYQSGRTRPGPILTKMRTPKNHGSGLAADCYPQVQNLNSVPRSWYEIFRRHYTALGLDNPAWSMGDLGHVQLSDPATRIKALAWVRSGFPPQPWQLTSSAAGRRTVRVLVNGEIVEDADANLQEDGRVLLRLRPITDAFDWTILAVSTPPNRMATVANDEREFQIPIKKLQDGRAYVEANDLRPMMGKVTFQSDTKKLYLVG